MNREAERLARKIAAGDMSPRTAAAFARALGATAGSDVVYQARMETRFYVFRGFGRTLIEAKQALLARWRKHVRMLELDPEWRAMHGHDTPDSIESLDEEYGVEVHEYRLGYGYMEDEDKARGVQA